MLVGEVNKLTNISKSLSSGALGIVIYPNRMAPGSACYLIFKSREDREGMINILTYLARTKEIYGFGKLGGDQVFWLRVYCSISMIKEILSKQDGFELAN